MANLVIKSTTFAPFSGGFTGVIPNDGTFYSEGGIYGPAPWLGEPVKEQEDVTFNDMAGTGTRDRGFRFRALNVNLIFSGSVSSVNTATKSFFESVRPLESLCQRFSISLPDGATLPGCHLRTTSSQRWENLTGKCLFLVSCTFHQMSLSN